MTAIAATNAINARPSRILDRAISGPHGRVNAPKHSHGCSNLDQLPRRSAVDTSAAEPGVQSVDGGGSHGVSPAGIVPIDECKLFFALCKRFFALGLDSVRPSGAAHDESMPHPDTHGFTLGNHLPMQGGVPFLAGLEPDPHR